MNQHSQHQRPSIICQIWNKPGHKAFNCRNWYNHAYQDEEIPQALAALSISDPNDPEWIPDSGATSHMTNDAGKLHSLKPYLDPDKIVIGDEKTLKITHIGDTSIFTPYG